MKWFKPEVKYSVVEIKEGTKLPELTSDLKESLKTLQFSPAFQYLMMRFRYKKAAIETAMKEGIDLTETQLRYLQAGIFWHSDIERDITTLTQVSASKPRPTFDNEQAEFERIQSNLDMIGA